MMILPRSPDALPLPSLHEVLRRDGLRADKTLGQHFLCDLNITRKIACAAGDLQDCTVVEVGPGPGGLTRALLETPARRVVVLEKDARFLSALRELATAYPERLEINHTDALTFDDTTISQPRAVVANLPYNIGTPLIIDWLRHLHTWRSLTVMVQYEVAQRLVALPNTRPYGRLSVLCHAVGQPRLAFRVPAHAFVPPPAVESAVVHITPAEGDPLSQPLLRGLERTPLLSALERTTAAAFGQRRKMLRRSVASLGGEPLLERAGIDPTRRGETLTVAEFLTLATCLSDATS